MPEVAMRLQQALAQLEDCGRELRELGEVSTDRILAIAALELKLRINRMGDRELRAITDRQATAEMPAPREYIRLPHESRN